MTVHPGTKGPRQHLLPPDIMRKILLSVGAIIFGASLLTLANGAVSTFLTVEMAKTGIPPALVGLVITGHAIGFILGCFIAGRAIRMVGHIRVFAAFAAAAAIATMAYTVSEVWWLWLVLRMIVGFCSAGLFTVAESWMSDRTPKEQRGSALSIYMISNKLAFASGQGLLILNETYGFVVLLVMSALYSFALIPVVMTRSTGPNIPQISTLHFKTVYRIAPAGLVGAVAVGLMTSGSGRHTRVRCGAHTLDRDNCVARRRTADRQPVSSVAAGMDVRSHGSPGHHRRRHTGSGRNFSRSGVQRSAPTASSHRALRALGWDGIVDLRNLCCARQ